MDTEEKNRSPHQIRVIRFLRLAGHEVPDVPTAPGADIRMLHARLITEEYLEAISELGIAVCARGAGQLELSVLDFFDNSSIINLPDLAKELADLSVTIVGAMAAFGIPDEAVLRVVDINNLEKFDRPGGYRDPSTQKWIKPPWHPKPDIETVLKAHGWQKATESNDHEKSNLS